VSSTVAEDVSHRPSPSVVSPIFSGAVSSLPTLAGVMHGRACNLLWTPAGSVLATCWKGMTHVDRCVGFGPRIRHGWMEELSTGLRKRGVRAWRDTCMASDMDGFPLCVGDGLTRDPIQIFYSFLDLRFSGTSWQVRTPRRLPPTRTPCTSTLSLSSNNQTLVVTLMKCSSSSFMEVLACFP